MKRIFILLFFSGAAYASQPEQQIPNMHPSIVQRAWNYRAVRYAAYATAAAGVVVTAPIALPGVLMYGAAAAVLPATASAVATHAVAGTALYMGLKHEADRKDDNDKN